MNTNFLIKQLAQAANMSERNVIKYRTMHHEKGWGGNWVANFLEDFVNPTLDEWEANYQGLIEWWVNYTNPNYDWTTEQLLRMKVLWKLCRANRYNKLRERILLSSARSKFENGKI